MADTNIVTGDLIQVQIFCQAAEQISVTTFKMKAGTVVPGYTYQNLVASLASAAGADILATLPATAKLLGFTLKRLWPLPAPATLTNATNNAGTVIQDLSPRQVTALVRKMTGMAGRANRGRAYWPFLPITFTDVNGNLTGAANTLIQTAVDHFLSPTVWGPNGGGQTAQLLPILTHKPLPAFVDVTDYAISPRIATQKRRGSFGRSNSSPF